MKKILVIAPFTTLPGEKEFNRFQYLSKLFSQRGHEVTLLTSKFKHSEKKHRSFQLESESDEFKIILLDEPGYKKNVSFSRIISHLAFELNLKKYLEKHGYRFDLIYCAYPLMGSAYFASNYASRKEIPFILDVQDIWPESINVVLKLPENLLNLLVFPFNYVADYIYKSPQYTIAVSDTYLNRATKNGIYNSNASSVSYIGTEISRFNNESKNLIEKPSGEFWLTYIGTLSYSYDIETLIKASVLLKRHGYQNIKINIFGKGPLEDRFKSLNSSLDSNVEFMGLVEYSELIPYLLNSDIALNSLTKNSKGSITNKFCDYCAAGLPILNSCVNLEVMSLVENEMGLNYEAGNEKDLFNKIIYLHNNQNLLKVYSANSKKFAENYLDRKNSYKKICEIIEKFIGESR